MTSLTRNFDIFSNIVAAPQKAYLGIQNNYPVLFPLLSIILLNVLMILFLYASIDYEWFIDHMVELQGDDLSTAEKDQTRQALGMMSPSMMGGIGAISVAVILPIVFSIQALYFVIVSGITNDGFQFKQWFSFTAWSSIPSLIGTLASFVVILTASNGQIAPESVNPLTLNELFFGLNPIKGAGSILASTDISIFWILALMTIGYSQWTDKTLAKSFLIVSLPFVLYYGVRFLLL